MNIASLFLASMLVILLAAAALLAVVLVVVAGLLAATALMLVIAPGFSNCDVGLTDNIGLGDPAPVLAAEADSDTWVMLR